MEVQPGARIDRYEIVRAVASGGMGTVWLARVAGKHGFEKRVALKTIRADRAITERARRMLLDEARIAARIEHAHVAQVLDLGEREGVLYIVMEWIEGASLERICRGLDDPARTELRISGELLRVIADACEGLHAAHELRDDKGELAGVIHRDVSPHNILVSRQGVAKLIDFGVAKAKDRIAGETEEGVIRGKLTYMAPEHALGRPLDRRADVWAMGAVLFRALAGESPFAEPGTLGAFIAGGPLPPLPGGVPDAVREVVSRALALAPADRYATAAEMQRALEDAMDRAGLRASRADVAERFAPLLREGETSSLEDPPTAVPGSATLTRATFEEAEEEARPAVSRRVLFAGVVVSLATIAALVALPKSPRVAPPSALPSAPALAPEPAAPSPELPPPVPPPEGELRSPAPEPDPAPERAPAPAPKVAAAQPTFVVGQPVYWRGSVPREGIVVLDLGAGQYTVHLLHSNDVRAGADRLAPRKRLEPAFNVGDRVLMHWPEIGRCAGKVVKAVGPEEYFVQSLASPDGCPPADKHWQIARTRSELDPF